MTLSREPDNRAATVAGLFRYPVKSMAGEHLEKARLDANGILGDRAWALRDDVIGGLRSGKRYPALMSLAAQFTEEPTEDRRSAPARIRFPDGSFVLTSDADAAAKIGAAIGADVSLWPLVSKQDLDHYRRPPAPDVSPADMEAGLRALFGRLDHEPLPDLGLFPPELMEFESPPGTYFDASSILIMSEESLASMASACTESAFDIRRFRPNILLSNCLGATASSAFPENDWVGTRLQIGTAVLHIDSVCPRCVMTTHPVEDLPKDPAIMRALVAQNDGNLGVYASVEKPGIVANGDAVTVLEP
ncbi:MAG: MOSC domain-containing protein [Pseudomonadaceae bacterium]|nr:MOSC domain-containing protein [Pseudomonadaceae bacterium]